MNVSAYLRKLDDEISGHRQAIALHQLEIARIEDARRVIVGIEERDSGHFGADYALNGAPVSPVLIARRPTSSEDGSASQAAKYGALPPPAPEPRQQQPRTRDGHQLTKRVLEFLKGQEEPLATSEIREAMGLVNDQRLTKRLHGALNSLKSRGIITWTPDHRYFYVEEKRSSRSRSMTGNKNRSGGGGGRLGETRVKVEKVLAQRGPLTAGEVVRAIFGDGPYDKASRDSVYNVLHSIRNSKTGAMIYDGQRYRMRQVLRAAE